MVLYAGRSIANMEVDNHGEWNGPFPSGGTLSSITFYGDIPSQIEVNELDIRFRIDYEFHDHPISDNGKGRFKAWLDVMRDGGWQQVDYKEDDLGNDHDDGDWYDDYEVSHTMEFPMEMYRIRLECRTKKTSLGTSVESSKVFTCVQAIGYVGDFTLDYTNTDGTAHRFGWIVCASDAGGATVQSNPSIINSSAMIAIGTAIVTGLANLKNWLFG